MRFPRVEITKRHSKLSIYGRFTMFRAKKDGSPYLRIDKTTWWDYNGFMIQTAKRKIIIIFKRHGAF